MIFGNVITTKICFSSDNFLSCGLCSQYLVRKNKLATVIYPLNSVSLSLLQQTIIAITHSNTETCRFDLATSENTFILSVGAKYRKIFAEKPRGYITVARRKSTRQSCVLSFT
jgi:hypothetical protein